MTATWATVDDLQGAWPDAVGDEQTLQRLLDAAQESLTDYAPALPDGADIPARYTEALLLHAREIWRSSERDGDVIGIGEFTVRAKDLTNQVKALLRPRKAVGTLR